MNPTDLSATDPEKTPWSPTLFLAERLATVPLLSPLLTKLIWWIAPSVVLWGFQVIPNSVQDTIPPAPSCLTPTDCANLRNMCWSSSARPTSLERSLAPRTKLSLSCLQSGFAQDSFVRASVGSEYRDNSRNSVARRPPLEVYGGRNRRFSVAVWPAARPGLAAPQIDPSDLAV